MKYFIVKAKGPVHEQPKSVRIMAVVNKALITAVETRMDNLTCRTNDMDNKLAEAVENCTELIKMEDKTTTSYADVVENMESNFNSLPTKGTIRKPNAKTDRNSNHTRRICGQGKKEEQPCRS